MDAAADLLQMGSRTLKEIVSGRAGCSGDPGLRVGAGFLQGTTWPRNPACLRNKSCAVFLRFAGVRGLLARPLPLLLCILEPAESFLPSYHLPDNQNQNWQHRQSRRGELLPPFWGRVGSSESMIPPQGHLRCLEVAGPATDPIMGSARLFCAKTTFLVCPRMDGEDRAWIQTPGQLHICF